MVKTFRELYPFESNWLELDGHQYHYIDEGKGEPFLMLHGNPTWSFYYRNIIFAFKDTHRCIAPDHMGCGFSDKWQDYPYTLSTHIDNIEKLADYLKLNNINLMVHDWGGAIGMGFAIRNPSRIRKIIFLNTAAFLDTKIPFSINLCRLPFVGDFLIRRLNAFALGALALAIKQRDRLTETVRSGYLAPYSSWADRIAHLRFVQDIPMTPNVKSYPVIKEIESKLDMLKKHPIMICWGMKDFCFDHDFLKRWRGFFPSALVHEFPEAGHYVLEDAHEKIITLVRNFLKT